MDKDMASVSKIEMDFWQTHKSRWLNLIIFKPAESQNKTKALAFLPALCCIFQNIIQGRLGTFWFYDLVLLVAEALIYMHPDPNQS